MRTDSPIYFRQILATLIQEGVKTIQRNVTSIGFENRYLNIYIDQEKYIVYLADGLYYANDKDIAGEFDYYAGSRVITTKQEQAVYEFHPENPKVNWELVRLTEGVIRLAYIQATNTLRRGAVVALRGAVAQPYYVKKRGLSLIQTILEAHLKKIFYVTNTNEDAQEYDIHVYPDYSDDNGTRFIAYIQIGYPTRDDYPLNCDNLSFFLVGNLLSGTCYLGTDFPWVTKPINLFDPRPQNGDSDWFSIDVLSAIQIFVSDAMRQIVSEFTIDQLFTSSFMEIGLKSDQKKVDAFALKILTKLQREFPVQGNTQPTIKFIPFSNGLTRFYAGILVMDIAVDTCGLVDISLLENIGKTDGWNSIWRVMDFQHDVGDNFYQPMESYGKTLPYSKLTTESRVVVEEVAKMIQSLMYQIDEIVDIVNEEV